MKKHEKMLYWAPRILSILFMGFLTMFSLDVFEPGLSEKDIAIGLLMHNIPSMVMIILLVIAWKREIVGAVAFIGAGLLYIGLTVFNSFNTGLTWYIAVSWSLTLGGPALFIGFLFLLNWKKRKYNNESHSHQREV